MRERLDALFLELQLGHVFCLTWTRRCDFGSASVDAAARAHFARHPRSHLVGVAERIEELVRGALDGRRR